MSGPLFIILVLGSILLLVAGVCLVVQVSRGAVVIGSPTLERDKDAPKKIRKVLTESQLAENSDLERQLQRETEKLDEITAMLKEFRSTVKNQLRNPYFMDRRNATVRSLYAALDNAKNARPDLGGRERFLDRRDDIQNFTQEVSILENVIAKAVKEAKSYRLNDAELSHWKRANELYVEVFEKPSTSEYARVAQTNDFYDACRHLPFVTFDNVLDVEPEHAS